MMAGHHIVRNKNAFTLLKAKSGFTLLEIMIAITILSFIMGIVYSSFSAISESDRRISLASESSLKARNLFAMMTKEISSVFVPPLSLGYGEPEDRLSYAFICVKEGDVQRINFTATLSDSGSISDVTLKELGYYLMPKEEGGYSLFKRVDVTPDDDISSGGSNYFLMDGVASLRYEFMKGEDEIPDVIPDEWDASDKGSLPKAVRVELSLVSAESDMETFSTTISLCLAKTF